MRTIRLIIALVAIAASAFGIFGCSKSGRRAQDPNYFHTIEYVRHSGKFTMINDSIARKSDSTLYKRRPRTIGLRDGFYLISH